MLRGAVREDHGTPGVDDAGRRGVGAERRRRYRASISLVIAGPAKYVGEHRLRVFEQAEGDERDVAGRTGRDQDRVGDLLATRGAAERRRELGHRFGRDPPEVLGIERVPLGDALR